MTPSHTDERVQDQDAYELQKKRILMVHAYHKRQEAEFGHRISSVDNEIQIKPKVVNGFKIVTRCEAKEEN